MLWECCGVLHEVVGVSGSVLGWGMLFLCCGMLWQCGERCGVLWECIGSFEVAIGIACQFFFCASRKRPEKKTKSGLTRRGTTLP